MKAPNPDGGGSSGSGFGTGYIVDNAVGGDPRTIYVTSALTTFADYKVGDTMLVTNVPTLGGEYTAAAVMTFATLADGCVITTTTPSSAASFTMEGL